MKRKLQIAGWLIALGAALVVPAFAQGPRANWAQNKQDNKPPKQRQQRQEQRRENRPQRQEMGRARNERQDSGASHPPNSKPNRADMMVQPNVNPNRPPSAYTPPPRRDFNSLSPLEKRKVLEDNRRLQRLPPAQRQELQERAQVWNRLTPEQRQHIQTNVLPKWQQMPPDRKRAIQQRLGVLKNMPESARNQHLNDPNFTRGMSEEDKATLRDLSHLHVGGAPEPPNE